MSANDVAFPPPPATIGATASCVCRSSTSIRFSIFVRFLHEKRHGFSVHGHGLPPPPAPVPLPLPSFMVVIFCRSSSISARRRMRTSVEYVCSAWISVRCCCCMFQTWLNCADMFPPKLAPPLDPPGPPAPGPTRSKTTIRCSMRVRLLHGKTHRFSVHGHGLPPTPPVPVPLLLPLPMLSFNASTFSRSSYSSALMRTRPFAENVLVTEEIVLDEFLIRHSRLKIFLSIATCDSPWNVASSRTIWCSFFTHASMDVKLDWVSTGRARIASTAAERLPICDCSPSTLAACA